MFMCLYVYVSICVDMFACMCVGSGASESVIRMCVSEGVCVCGSLSRDTQTTGYFPKAEGCFFQIWRWTAGEDWSWGVGGGLYSSFCMQHFETSLSLLPEGHFP